MNQMNQNNMPQPQNMPQATTPQALTIEALEKAVATIPAINGIAFPALSDCKRMSKRNGGRGLASNEGKAALYHAYALVKNDFLQEVPGYAFQAPTQEQVAVILAGLGYVAGADKPVNLYYLMQGMTEVKLPTKLNGLKAPAISLKAPSRLKALVKAWGDCNGKVLIKNPDEMNTPKLSAPKSERKPTKEETMVKAMGEEDLEKWKARQVSAFLKRMGWIDYNPTIAKEFIENMFAAAKEEKAIETAIEVAPAQA